MNAGRYRGQNRGTHERAGNVLAPNAVPTRASDGKHYLVWGVLRLTLGVVQIAFAAMAILCLIFVGLSSATLTCAAVATSATLASRALFHGRRGAH